MGDFNYASDEALIVATRNALPGLIAEIRISRLALANVRMYAAIKIRKTDPESAEHLLRLCAEAGVTGSVVRGEGAS